MHRSYARPGLALLALLAALVGCTPAPTPLAAHRGPTAPAPTATLRPTERPTRTPTPQPTATRKPSPTAPPTATRRPTRAPRPASTRGAPTATPTATAPWTGYRCDQCIKGNISVESGERIYHIPGCEYYDETRINPDYGERWFSSEAEALEAGWRKALNCP